MKKKRISIYVQGDVETPEYYRIYQFTDRIEGISPAYHMMLPSRAYQKFMPISQKSIFVKIYTYLLIYVRMLTALIHDNISLPDALIVHRRIISRFMPGSYFWLLKRIHHKGVPIYWDIDDHILENKEITPRSFAFFERISSSIIVTHDYLAHLISEPYREKVLILPTTDGDMYQLGISEEVRAERLKSLTKEIRLVWVATATNLIHLEGIIDELDDTAHILKQTQKRQLCLDVICNYPLNASTKHLKVNNIKWTRQAAIDGMRKAHVGIMPLDNTTFAMGKGGFKLVQYISIGLPCIGSNVGYNKAVINESCGILIDTPEQWSQAILQLGDADRWNQYSLNASRQWKAHFSYDRNLNFWKQLLKA